MKKIVGKCFSDGTYIGRCKNKENNMKIEEAREAKRRAGGGNNYNNGRMIMDRFTKILFAMSFLCFGLAGIISIIGLLWYFLAD